MACVCPVVWRLRPALDSRSAPAAGQTTQTAGSHAEQQQQQIRNDDRRSDDCAVIVRAMNTLTGARRRQKRVAGSVCGAQSAEWGRSQIPIAATCTGQRIASLDHCAVRGNNETNDAHAHIAALRSLPSLSPRSHPPPPPSASTPPAWSFVEPAAGRRRKCNRQSNRRCSNRRRRLLLLLLSPSLQIQPAHLVVAAVGAAAAAAPSPVRLAP